MDSTRNKLSNDYSYAKNGVKMNKLRLIEVYSMKS